MSDADNNRRANCMRTVRTKVYKFNELSPDAQTSVISQHIDYMIKYEHEDHYANWPEYKKAIDEAEEMRTPWFAGSYVYDYCLPDIREFLNDSDCEYTKDGKPFNK